MLAAITVLLFSQHHPVEVKVDGRPITQAARYSGVHSLEIPGEPPRKVQGLLEIKPVSGRYRITLKMDMDRYVAATLAGESNSFPPGEAMRAMAVAIRTYAQGNIGRHKAEGADVCDDTHCQKLRFQPNSASAAAAIEAAVRMTRGELIWYGREIARVYYHQHCGGKTESANQAWGGRRIPYLVSQPDPFCVRLSSGVWKSTISRETFERTHQLPGNAKSNLIVADRSTSGRVTLVRFGEQRWTGTQFRQAVAGQLGRSSVPSESFHAALRGDDIVLEGRGSGHGVGICQTGMVSRAAAGHGYKKILAAYLPGTRVGINPDGFSWHHVETRRLDVHTTEPESDTSLAIAADHLLAFAERLTRREYPGRPQLRVYPSVSDFREAANGADSSFYHSNGDVLSFQPAGILQSTGSLRLVTLRGLIRLIIDDAANSLPGRLRPPGWFREGLALHLAPGRLRTIEQSRDWERVAELMARWGRETVLGWIETGIPRYAVVEEERMLVKRRLDGQVSAVGRFLAP